MKVIELLIEAEDFVTKALKPLKLKWKESKKNGEHQLVTIDGTHAFQIYYDPTDELAVGWALGEVKPNGKYDWGGSGTDDLDDVIKRLKDWVKE